MMSKIKKLMNKPLDILFSFSLSVEVEKLWAIKIYRLNPQIFTHRQQARNCAQDKSNDQLNNN